MDRYVFSNDHVRSYLLSFVIGRGDVACGRDSISLHVWKSAGVCSSGNNGNKRQNFQKTNVMLKYSAILAQSL